MQALLVASVASSLTVPQSAVSFLGVSSPSSSGVSRALQSGVRVQLGVVPAAAVQSPTVQALLTGPSSSALAAAVSGALTAGFSAALLSQPQAAAVAGALGYASASAMAGNWAQDTSLPVAALVLSATPLPSAAASPPASTSPSAALAIVVGVAAGFAIGLYLLIVSVLACCKQCSCCCQHALYKESFRTRTVWCWCCCCFGGGSARQAPLQEGKPALALNIAPPHRTAV